jgi:hypothetical protein
MPKLGVVVNRLRPGLVPFIRELDVDSIQISFHLGMPDIRTLEQLSQEGIECRGKYVPSKGEQDDPNKFTENIHKIAKDYGHLVQSWDFGGEPETPADKPGCRWFGTPTDFLTQYFQFKSILRDRVGEDVQIGCGGFVSATFNGFFGNEDRSQFLRVLVHEGLLACVDFLSFDLFVYGYGGEKNIVAGSMKVRQILGDDWDKIPFRIVETGIPCAGDPKFYHIIQEPMIQAGSLAKCFALFFSSGFSDVTWFALHLGGWGLLDERLRRRPSFGSLKVLSQWIRGFDFAEQIKVYPQDRYLTDYFNWIRFQRGEDFRDIVWLDSEKQYSFSLPSGLDCIEILSGKTFRNKEVRFSSVPLILMGNLKETGNFVRSKEI